MRPMAATVERALKAPTADAASVFKRGMPRAPEKHMPVFHIAGIHVKETHP